MSLWAAGAAGFLFAFSGSAAQEEAAAAAPSQSGTAFSAFKPGIAVIIAILTMFFCITFLVLLYAKHCNAGRGDGVVSYYLGGGDTSRRGGGVEFPRKNSGVDRSLVESLPVFRFASLRGHKDGLECAVCLNRFESVEVLRLLPKCKHAFHVECVDTWLDAHSTCPLCRYRVDPGDLLLVEPIDDPSRKSLVESIRRISGRHSSAGERGEAASSSSSSCRRSYDDRLRAKNEYRKDGLLMAAPVERKVEHRIIISGPTSTYERWSDVLPSDLLYLRSEMVMNGRSASDVTGAAERRSDLLSREAGTLARWTAWISQPRDVRSLALTPSP